MDRPSVTPNETVGSWTVQRVTETGSTNDDLFDLGRAGATDRTALVTAHQTAGKGRLDRRWDAPAGTNLLVSLLFRSVPANPHELVHAVALAAANAAVTTIGVAPVIKWPNDLLGPDGQEKLAGILATAGPFAGDRPSFVVVGLGFNVNWAPEGATSLSALAGRVLSVDDVLRAFLHALDRFAAMSPGQLHEAYRKRLGTLRREVVVHLPGDETVEGRALDIESDGRLVVLDRCGVTHRFSVGDVVHVRTTNFGS